MNNTLSHQPITYVCCRCIYKEDTYANVIFCRVCNLSVVCKDCFSSMEIKCDVCDIVCPICSNVYFGELRNNIVKYALQYYIGTDKMPFELLCLWKRNSMRI